MFGIKHYADIDRNSTLSSKNNLDNDFDMDLEDEIDTIELRDNISLQCTLGLGKACLHKIKI